MDPRRLKGTDGSPLIASSVRPFQAPRTRLRLEAAFGGLVLAGRKGRASHRHRSGLKIPARPLSAPATPAKAGHAPCFIGPPALQKSAPDYRRLPATRPSDKSTTIYSPESSIQGGHPIHGYAHRELSVPSFSPYAAFPSYVGPASFRLLSVTAISPCACQIQTGMRRSIRPVRGAYALISNRTDSTPP
jgi:hypothetical protein